MTHDTELLWRELHDRLRAFIARRVDNPADVEDLLQEVFLRIHQHLSTVRETGRLLPWIFQLTRNAITDYYRAASRRHEIPGHSLRDSEENTGEREAPPSLQNDEQTSQQYDLAPCLTPLIERLPEHYRQAVLLVEMEGLPQRELSERLAVSLSGAKSRVQRGRDKLKELLLRCCQVELDKRGSVMNYQPDAGACGSVASTTTSSVAQPAPPTCRCTQPKGEQHERSTL
ncbi:MAG: RNA polymerase sigma factor SigZ [Deltaproteobacteria bacterium]|nr:RNA polymerase sigma factor SigZ [Deltaproteobacteria bacterium]